MTNQVESLPVEIASKVTSTTQKKLSGDRAVTSLVDTLHKAKIPSTHLISPKPKGDTPSQSTASQQWFDEFNAAIVLGFSATTQKILSHLLKLRSLVSDTGNNKSVPFAVIIKSH